MRDDFRVSRRLRPVVFASLGAMVGLGGFGWVGTERFITPKRRELEPRHRAVIEAPAEYGLELGEVFSVSAPGDGAPLRCRLISPAREPGAAIKTRRMRARLGPGLGTIPAGTVVMLHGRGGIKEDAFPVAERFVAAGLRCLVYDARAHGESGGRHSTYGARETADLRAVIDEAHRRYGEEMLGPLVAFGISQGAAVLLQALPDEPRLHSAVVVSPFADLPTVTRRAGQRLTGGLLPEILTDGVTGLGGWRAGFSPTEIRPVDAAPRIRVPVMVVHGDRDAVIPLAEGRRVHEALPHPGRRWRPVIGGFHGDVLAVGGDALYQEIMEFWLATLPPPSASPSQRD